MDRQVLYVLATGRVLMAGYCDWTLNPIYDAAIHGIVVNDTHVFPDGCYYDDNGNEVFWYWDGSEFTQTAP